MRAPAFTRRAALAAGLLLPATARADGSFAAIRGAGRLRLGLLLDDTPMAFRNPAARLDGMAVAVGRALAEGMGVEPDFHLTTFGDQVDALREGRVDLLVTAPAMTLEAARVMMFSTPYAELDWHLLARRDLALRGLDEVGRRPLVQLRGWNSVFGNQLLGERPRHLLLRQDWREIAEALAQGEAEAAIVPATLAARITEALPAIETKSSLGRALMAVTAPFGAHDLLEAVNAQLLLLRQRGVLAILHQHFLGTRLRAGGGP